MEGRGGVSWESFAVWTFLQWAVRFLLQSQEGCLLLFHPVWWQVILHSGSPSSADGLAWSVPIFLQDLPNERGSKICRSGKQESRSLKATVLDDKQMKSSGKIERQEEWMQSAALQLQQSMVIARKGTTSKRSLEKELGIIVVGKENVLRCHEKGKAVVEPAGDVKWSFCSTPLFKDLSWSSVMSFELCTGRHVWACVQGGAVRYIRRHTTD